MTITHLLKKSLLLVGSYLLFQTAASTQTLIPYLGQNGLTGLADESGKVVIAPQFTKLDRLVAAEAPVFHAYKDGNRMRVLKNRMMFPDHGGPSFFWVNHKGETGLPVDTMKHLIALDFQGDLVFVNLKTGKKVAALRNAAATPSWFIYDKHRLLGSHKYAKAVHGVIRVGRPFSRINFLDTNLNIIFPQDFVAGTVVDDQYFIVAKAALECAIADRSGKVLTKFDWNFLEGTPKKGFFVAGFAGKDPSKPNGLPRFGLIDAKGKYRIEPIFKRIRAAGDQYLMVRDDNGEGIMDYSGRLLSPMAEGYLDYAFGDLFVRDPNFEKPFDASKKPSLMNAQGKSQLSFEVEKLEYVGASTKNQPYFQFQRGALYGVISTDLKLVFQDSATIEAIVIDGNTYFKLTRTGKTTGSDLLGLRDFEGNEILPLEYESIKPQYNTNLIEVKKDGMLGLVNIKGQEILPSRYDAIQLSLSDGGNTLFGKKNKLYLAFDENGKRKPEDDCLNPGMRKDKLVYQPNTPRGQPKEVIFADGNAVKTPLEWGNNVNLKGRNSPVGILVIKENPGNYELYDTKLKALLPKGFRIPRKLFNPRAFDHVGLVPVWQQNPESSWVESPQEVPEKPQKPVKAEAPIRINADDDNMPDIAIKEVGPEYIGCGVMNALGEWVIPPTPDARFEPVSWNLMVEYPASGPERIKKYPRKLHRVNHPEPRVFDISRTEGWDEGLAWSNCIAWQLQDNPEDPSKGKVQRCTWFSRDGEQLAPFQFAMGPRHLKAQNVVSLYENGKKIGLIVDEKAQKIADFNDLDEIPGHGYSLFTDGYVVAKKGGKWGVLDSVGQVAVPFNFGELTILEGRRFLQEENDGSPKKYRLLNWQGAFMAEADIPVDLRVLESGECFAALNFRTVGESNNAHSLIFSAEGNKVAEVPGRFTNDVDLSETARYAKFRAADKREFWVNLATGRVYMEY